MHDWKRDPIWQFVAGVVAIVFGFLTLAQQNPMWYLVGIGIVIVVVFIAITRYIHNHIITDHRKMLLFALASLALVFLLTNQPKRPMVSRFASGNNPAFATPTTLQASYGIEKNGMRMVLSKTVPEKPNNVTIYWLLTNISKDSFIIPESFYGNVVVSDNLGNQLKVLEVACMEQMCKNYMLEPGREIEYSQGVEVNSNTQVTEIIVTTSNLEANNVRWVIPINN